MSDRGSQDSVDLHREERLAQVADATLAKRLWGFVAPYKGLVVMSLLLLPAASALTLVQPYLIQRVIDDHLVPGELAGLGWKILAFAGCLVGEYILLFAQFYVMQLAGQRALRDLRCTVFQHLQRLSVGYFHRNPVGRLMTRLTTDIDSLQEALSSGVVTIIGDVLTLSAIVVILLVKSTRLALVTFAVVPVLVLLTFVFRVLMRRAYRILRVKIARLNAFLQEAVTGMRIIQVFRREERARADYDGINREHRDAAFDSIKYDATLYAVVETLSSIAVAGIIWFGAGQTLQGLVTLGVLVAFIEYVQKFFVPIRELSQKYTLIQSAMAAAERLFQILDTRDTTPIAATAKPISELRDAIRFENVSFSYDGETPILRDVSFTVRRGEKVAIVGHTGAGKTTITSLLTRLYDVDEGRITIDGTDIRDFDLRDLRRLFALVLQDVFLFSGDLRRNIALRADEIPDGRSDQAARTVGLDRVLARHKDGLDQEVKERGANLSAGERQLVAFARALAHRPEILVLDEATANVDTETEAVVQKAVDCLVDRQTSVVIAHRLSTVQRVDRIVVMHHGEVAEVGSHAELMAAGGLYRTLVRLQYHELRRPGVSAETAQ